MCVCVCVCDREREREYVSVCKRKCVCARVSTSLRWERMSVRTVAKQEVRVVTKQSGQNLRNKKGCHILFYKAVMHWNESLEGIHRVLFKLLQ